MAKTSHVVMLATTYDAKIGDVVAVSPEDAERLVANANARRPRPGEVKTAESK